MARLDARSGQVLIDAPPSPRLPRIMQQLRACRDGPLWRTDGHRALDVADALLHARPERTEAFEDLSYRLFYGGEPDDVQACLALRRGLEAPGIMPSMDKPLYPYQEQAVAFLDRAGSGILADEPGLGKTLQGIAFALLSPGPCLVVCPASAKHVWEREIAASTQADVQVLEGTSPVPMARARFTIVNYDILAAHASSLQAHGFGCLVADEVHRCKNLRARRTQALVQVARGIPRKALLSGTLMLNGAEDLFPALHIVRPAAFPDARAFAERYTEARPVRRRVRGRWRTQSIRIGSRHLQELHRRMEPFTIRRTLAEVRDQLPDVRHTVVAIDLPEDLEPAYRAAWHGIDPAGPGASLQAAQNALAVCVQAKVRELPRLLADRRNEGRKTLVFSTRLALLDAVQDAATEPCVRIDGSVPVPSRRVIEETFQKDPGIRLFLGQTRACGEALTLDAADTVVIAEADWSPQANEQAVRRAVRIGTDHPIEVVWFVVRGTLDEARLMVLERKRQDFNTVFDARDVLAEALSMHG